MSLNSVNGKSYFFEAMNAGAGKSRNLSKDRQDAFSGNLKEMMQESEEHAAEKESGVKNRTSVQVDYQYGRAAASIRLYQNGRVGMGGLLECESRHISYSESDVARAFVTEGYTLKAKVIMEEHLVYIEQVSEDGSSRAYEVNPLKISENTENPIEQIAAEAWEKTREMLNGGVFTEWDPYAGEPEDETAEILTFEEMLQDFRDFVEKRLKEGPPKIQIGGSEFSQKEWEQLLKKIDKDIDAYKEELRARVRKRNGQKVLAKEAGSAAEAGLPEGFGEVKADSPAAESQKKESPGISENEAKESPAISENEAIESPGVPERGRSFQSRLAGGKRAPYSYLKDETGNITYHGVTFVCEDEKQRICLGDMSNPNNVLRIPLSGGGSLCVNRDNLSDLVKAIDMFSPEDIARILQAIAKDAKAREAEVEIKKASLEAF